MEKIVFSQITIDFVKVALEYCSLIENAGKQEKRAFINRATTVLPLLYLNISLIPEVEEYYDSDLENRVNEELYEKVAAGIAEIMADNDLFLETFHPDIRLSDSPVAVKISENLTDIYQDLGDFISIFKNGQEETMNDALVHCIRNFKEYWGQKLVNVLRALHQLKYQAGEEEIEN